MTRPVRFIAALAWVGSAAVAVSKANACVEPGQGSCTATLAEQGEVEELSALQRRETTRRDAHGGESPRGGGSKQKIFPLPGHLPRLPDWVIIGGGGAGCAAAAALADAGEDVVVLERGPSNLEYPNTMSAYGWPDVVNEVGELIRWTEGTWGVVGNVLGGGTSINAGLFIADRPEWFQEALPGVSLEGMYASYHKLASELATPTQPTPFNLAFARAQGVINGVEANLSDPQVMYTPGQPFVAYSTYNWTLPKAPRSGSAVLMNRRANMSNLHVATGALVHRIVFRRGTAIGVKVSFKSQHYLWKHFLRARKGVVLSAGAVHTPKLLQISGVGPKHVVDRLGVRLVSDLPGVGRNFTDRLISNVGVVSPTDLKQSTGFVVNVDLKKSITMEGVGGGNISTAFAVTTLALVAPEKRTAALRPLLKKVFGLLTPETLENFNRVVVPTALQTNTHSRGHIEATSTEVWRPPNVTANYFKDRRDWLALQVLFDTVLELFNTTALENFSIPKEPISNELAALLIKYVPDVYEALACLFRPVANNKYVIKAVPCLPAPFYSREARDTYLRDTVISSYHYFGTAAAGEVVDAVDFSVKGVTGLYVVDASVIPFPTEVNPQATVMALGDYVGTKLAHRDKHT